MANNNPKKGSKTYSETIRGTFDCCRKCGDKRTVGCHGWCKDYIEAYAKHEQDKKNLKNSKQLTERRIENKNK